VGDAGVDAAPGTPPVIPFDALSVASYVSKVKTILTGLAPTQAEIDGVTQDATSLGSYVDGWMKLPAYSAKMELFFATPFNNRKPPRPVSRRHRRRHLHAQRRPAAQFPPKLRQDDDRVGRGGSPVHGSATTTRYMMTTAMMTYYAYADTSMLTDATATSGGNAVNRYYDADKNWTCPSPRRPTSARRQRNPASPNYLKFTARASRPSMASTTVRRWPRPRIAALSTPRF